MSKLMMCLQMLLVLVFFIGIEVKADMNRCVESLKAEEEFNSIVNQAGEEQLKLFCSNMTSFLQCINDVMKEETGFNLKELASLLKETDIGRALTIMVNVEDLVKEICTEGSQLNQDYLASAECYRGININELKECEAQAKDAYETFRGVQTSSGHQQAVDQQCVISAYQLGCLGTVVHEECGEVGFKTYKEIVKKVGIFKSGICSSQLMERLKTDFVDSLDMSDSHKSLYRVILDLKKRRR